MDSYAQFLASKRILAQARGLGALPEIHAQLFPFQRDAVRRALEFGKMALFEECGLGKTIQQLEWARHVVEHTSRPVIIFAPLAVAEQTVREARLIDLEARIAKSKEDITKPSVYVTNYQKLHLFDCLVFGGVVLDESSILKHQDGHYRTALIDSFARCPFKLCCTATPSPNDFMELGNHAEFLDVITRSEMLATFFVHDAGETQVWRLKKHAVNDFWAWVSSWSIAIRHPRDLGYEMFGFDLPPISYIEHVVESDITSANGEDLFMLPASSLSERRSARKRSHSVRIEKVVELVTSQPDELFILWCNTNVESEELAKLIPDAVEVTGSDSDEHKTKSLIDFADGKIRVLVSKSSIAGWGLNLQRCHNAVFVSLSDSFEGLYQAVRRIYRFGQTKPVNIHLVSSSLEGAVMRNIKRKADQHEHMVEAMVKKIKSVKPAGFKYASDTVNGDGWTMLLGDCVDACKTIEKDSIHFSIYSLPFSSLYTYSHSERDMGNTRGNAEFFEHYSFLVAELIRVMMPGRLVAVHCMNLPTSKERDGVIGIRDFRGSIIKAMEQHGFIYHSEVCIRKDPVTAMQRTKALGLLHKQIKKDSCMSRQGLPDYLCVFRKPGTNPEPVDGEFTRYIGKEGTGPDGSLSPVEMFASGKQGTRFSIEVWQRYAEPVWMDINPSDTLQRESAREQADERHIAPLQLQVIRRALDLWTNPGDLVLDPFAGIGSSGYEAVKANREFIGIELKKSYFDQSVANLRNAVAEKATLFNTHFREAEIEAGEEFARDNPE